MLKNNVDVADILKLYKATVTYRKRKKTEKNQSDEI